MPEPEAHNPSPVPVPAGWSPRWRVPLWSRLLARGDRGRLGERLAARHLRRHGYRILARNERLRAGELDIVARTGDVLAVVEVRTRQPGAPQAPEASVDRAKQARIIRATDEWLLRRGMPPMRIRFDVIAIEIDDAWHVTRFAHFERAFDAPRGQASRR